VRAHQYSACARKPAKTRQSAARAADVIVELASTDDETAPRAKSLFASFSSEKEEVFFF
jgi:hypothetical protein